MGQKRSKNQIRRERMKLRKLGDTEGNDEKSVGSEVGGQKHPEPEDKSSKSEAPTTSEKPKGEDEKLNENTKENTKEGHENGPIVLAPDSGDVSNAKPETELKPEAQVPIGTATDSDDKDKNDIQKETDETVNPPEALNGGVEESATGKNVSHAGPDRTEEEQQESTAEKPESDDLDAESNKKKLLDIFSRLGDAPAAETEEPAQSAPNEQSAQKENGEHKTGQSDLLAQFSNVFNRFEQGPETTRQSLQQLVASSASRTSPSDGSSSDASESEDSDENSRSLHSNLSKRQKRIRDKVPISVLKASTNKPQAVEWYDADAPDPFMAVHLKTALNVIDVPLHWQQKKEYLSSKRGVERAMFELPKFIENTGIAEMRHHDPDSLKKLQRERVQPKMGRLDIDYQKLHDAFFKFQTKPRLLAYGEVYSEGREKADHYRESVARMRPGKILKALRLAAGMSDSDSVAPPWIMVMQDLGKPPSYLDLIIPGLDVEYTNLGYRIDSGENGASLKLLADTWGNLEDGEESEQELESLVSDEDEDGEDEEVEDSDEVVTGVKTRSAEKLETVSESADKSHMKSGLDSDKGQPERVEIAEYSKIKGVHPAEPSKYTGQESLYKVLKEKSRDSDGLTGKVQGYEIDDSERSESKSKHEKKLASKADEHAEFKF